MRTFWLLFLVLDLLALPSLAQQEGAHWYFGHGCGLRFGPEGPVVSEGGPMGAGLSYIEGSSSISDGMGALLFYTDGETIWNNLHLPMPNGSGLMGSSSSTQSSIIVPRPGSSRFYYVFTVADYYETGLANGLRYSVVDICAANGQGDVVSDMKNIHLLDTVEEKLALVRHANGIDYWLLTHTLYDDDFHAFRISAEGITEHAISHVGAVHTGFQGQLKCSPDGTLLASASARNYIGPYRFELFDLDVATGTVSGSRELTVPNDASVYGVEFSPDNGKLYAAYGGVDPITMGVAQYDLTGPMTAGAINSTMQVVQTMPYLTLRALQVGPDGRIYMPGLTSHLHVIGSPNEAGANCNFQVDAIHMGAGTVGQGLPAFVAGYDYSALPQECSSLGYGTKPTTSKSISIAPNPAHDEFHVQGLGEDEGAYMVTLVCLDGRAMKTVPVATGTAIKRADLGLAGGHYTVLVHSTRTKTFLGATVMLLD